MASLLDVGMFSYMMLELIRELERGDIHLSTNDSSTTKSEKMNIDDVIRSIPDVLFQENVLRGVAGNDCNDQTCCAICTDDFVAGDVLNSLPPCRHLFHKDCVIPWLTQYKGCCPLCMRNIKA
eukprot:725691_1